MRARTVVVAHRNTMVAEGITAALRRYPHIAPVGFATTASECERLGERAFALAIDHQLGSADRVATNLRRKGVRVVFIGGPESGDGERTRVPMDASVSALASALVPGIAPREARPDKLTPRQREVLELVGRGLAAKEIARQLGISVKTVERHKSRIFGALGVPNQAAAAFVSAAARAERSDSWNRSTM